MKFRKTIGRYPDSTGLINYGQTTERAYAGKKELRKGHENSQNHIPGNV